MNPELRAFNNAKGRCNSPSATGYKNYGGRGIEFRFDSYEQFIKELGPRPTPKHSLDRIDNDGHYEVGNVRWATRSEQNRNRRPNSPEARRRQSEAAKARCTPEWKQSVSDRVKKQHAEGNFGQQTWDDETKRTTYKKISEALKGKPSGRLGKPTSPESRERYRAAALRREASRRAAKGRA